MYGGYEGIKEGNVANCLKDLTGAPIFSYKTGYNKDLFSIIQNAVKKEFIIAAVNSGLDQKNGKFTINKAYPVIKSGSEDSILLKNCFEDVPEYAFNG